MTIHTDIYTYIYIERERYIHVHTYIYSIHRVGGLRSANKLSPSFPAAPALLEQEELFEAHSRASGGRLDNILQYIALAHTWTMMIQATAAWPKMCRPSSLAWKIQTRRCQQVRDSEAFFIL